MAAYKVSEKLHYTLIGVAMCGFILSLFGGRGGFGFGAFFITACGFRNLSLSTGRMVLGVTLSGISFTEVCQAIRFAISDHFALPTKSPAPTMT